MDTAKDIEKYTTDTQSLIDSIGDISNGSVHDIIDKYDQISKDWNSFLDDQGAKYGLTFDPKQTDQEKIDMRFKRAYEEINEVSKYNYVVVNDEVNVAARKVQAILEAERCRVDRIEEVYLNTEEEKIHETLFSGRKEFDNSELNL